MSPEDYELTARDYERIFEEPAARTIFVQHLITEAHALVRMHRAYSAEAAR